MQMKLGRLRELIREVNASLGGSDPNEAYDKSMSSDPAWKKRSVYVPKKDKDEINDWLSDMGMDEDQHGNKRAGSA